jgi:hypothetical protein
MEGGSESALVHKVPVEKAKAPRIGFPMVFGGFLIRRSAPGFLH